MANKVVPPEGSDNIPCIAIVRNLCGMKLGFSVVLFVCLLICVLYINICYSHVYTRFTYHIRLIILFTKLQCDKIII